MHLTYATRRSALALAQARGFVEQLTRVLPALQARELQLVTTGDRTPGPLHERGGKALFVREIDAAVLAGRVDFAVHSLKDVPTVLPAGLVIACVPAREDPRDALVAPRHRTLAALPPGARIGTCSPRRMAAIRAARPDLITVAMRGNVDTRLRRVAAGDYDAIVLARAGLLRLGRGDAATSILPINVALPAAGQGALAIVCRAGDARTLAAVARLHHEESARCVAAERAVLEAIDGDCQTPVGAYARPRRGAGGAVMQLQAVLDLDATSRRAIVEISWPASDRDAARFGRVVGRGLVDRVPGHDANSGTRGVACLHRSGT